MKKKKPTHNLSTKHKEHKEQTIDQTNTMFSFIVYLNIHNNCGVELFISCAVAAAVPIQKLFLFLFVFFICFLLFLCEIYKVDTNRLQFNYNYKKIPQISVAHSTFVDILAMSQRQIFLSLLCSISNNFQRYNNTIYDQDLQ